MEGGGKGRGFWAGLAAMITAIATLLGVLLPVLLKDDPAPPPTPPPRTQPPTPPTASIADWSRNADRICSDAKEELSSLAPTGDTFAESVEDWGRIAETWRDMAVRVKALEAPDAQRTRVADMVSSMERVADRAGVLRGLAEQAGESGTYDDAEARGIGGEMTDAGARAETIAGQLGAEQCSSFAVEPSG